MKVNNSKFKNVVFDVLNLMAIYLLTEGLTLLDRRCRYWIGEYTLVVDIMCMIFKCLILILIIFYIKRSSDNSKYNFRMLVEKILLMFFIIYAAQENALCMLVRVKPENFSEMLGFLLYYTLFLEIKYGYAVYFLLLFPPVLYVAYVIYKKMKKYLIDDYCEYRDIKKREKKLRPVIINFFIFKHYTVQRNEPNELVIEIEDKRRDNNNL